MAETFKRVEDKYQLTYSQAKTFIEMINSHIAPDMYHKYTVNSLYYDNDDCDLIVNSLNKPKYKMKLRLRSYGNPSEDSKVFLETKKKLGNIVYKRRIELGLQEAYDYLNYGKSIKVNNNTAKEIDYILKYYNLQPKVLICYDRICYHAIEESDVRITFDTNIRYRIHDVTLSENGSEKKLNEGHVMLEIKAMNRYPLWLVRVLSEMKLYKQGFSKYGNIYRANFEEMHRDVNYEQLLVNKNEEESRLCSIQY